MTMAVREGFSGAGKSDDWNTGIASMMKDFEAGFDLSEPMALEDYTNMRCMRAMFL